VKVSDLAQQLGGELIGDGDVQVHGVSPVDAVKPGHVTLAENEQFFAKAEASDAAAIVVSLPVDQSRKPLIRVRKTTLALAKMLAIFHPAQKPEPGVHPTAFVGAGVDLGGGVHIGPNAVVRDGATIGDRVVIHSGTVVGSDGFGYALDGATRVKIPQVGTVVIEDDVEIGANVAIDRSTLGATVIKRGTKIDNLVQIAHNVVIGENTVVCGLVGISGSVTIGDNVTLAGQVGMADHVTIGSNATIGAQSGVTKDLEGGKYYLGSPAVPIGLASRQYAVWANLPELSRRVRELEKQLEELKRRSTQSR